MQLSRARYTKERKGVKSTLNHTLRCTMEPAYFVPIRSIYICLFTDIFFAYVSLGETLSASFIFSVLVYAKRSEESVQYPASSAE